MSFEKSAEGSEVLTATRASAKETARYRKQLGAFVQVSRYKIPIIYVKDLKMDGKQLHGVYIPDKKTIMVDISKEDIVETLLHEVFHAELHLSGVSQNPNWCNGTEETVVELLSRAVAHAFRLRAVSSK